MSILLIYHASKCNNPNCTQYLCKEIKQILYHIEKEHNGDFFDEKCEFEDCNHIRGIIKHYNKCRKSDNICKKCYIQNPILLKRENTKSIMT